jgi:hypothetical protein
MLRFNALLKEEGIEPAEVRLLRHLPVLPDGRHLIDLWHSNRAGFEAWQSLQDTGKRANLQAPYWASFIGTWDGRTVFAGLYRASPAQILIEDCTVPLTGGACPAGSSDVYRLERLDRFDAYAGRLLIDWGGGASGKRAWIQRADRQDKPITAILEDRVERSFPGFLAFREILSDLDRVPSDWITKLNQARGVYLLACPATGGLYIGSATGSGGFWSRWQNYRLTGHGGNLGLQGIDTSVFYVSILQLAGSADTSDDILALEAMWKVKLDSRAFGFTRN